MQKLQFLCANHRAWLFDNPRAAAATWAQAYSRSLELVDEAQYPEAVRHAGCAFETAELLLAETIAAPERAVSRFSDSGVLLVQLLKQVGQVDLAVDIRERAIFRLQGLLQGHAARPVVMEGCRRLMRMNDELPKSTGYRPSANVTPLRSGQIH